MLATAMTLGLCAAAYRAFSRSPDAYAYILAADQSALLAGRARTTLDTLIEKDAVTWDPTESTHIDEVLTHLKRTDKKKLLMVGASQLMLVSDDLFRARMWQRVDRVLTRIAGVPLEVYNLSKQQMSGPEKEIVINAATSVMDFDYVLLSATLWDCRRENVSRGLARVRDAPDLRLASRTEGVRRARISPSKINDALHERLMSTLRVRSDFFVRRSAIQQWCADKFKRRLGFDDTFLGQGPHAGKEAPLMQYVVDTPEKEELSRRISNSLLDCLADLKKRTGGKVAVLFPPFRQDAEEPFYMPEAYFEEFRDIFRARCAEEGLLFLDASALLGQSHFHVVGIGKRCQVDCVHFDAAGHELLANFIAEELGLR